MASGSEVPRRVVIAGAGGRDFHDFATVFKNDPSQRVVAFTAAQIPGIDDRVYPAVLAGEHYPSGIPIVPESTLSELIEREQIDDVVLAYSDLSHEAVMHLASIVLAAGADFRLLGPRSTSLPSTKPVIAVCATRTGAGKSPATRAIARVLRGAGLRVVLVRHPMPYGDLARMRVQRFATLADIDAADPTIEEREEYEEPVREGMIMFAGVDYAAILAAAEQEADVIVWDGGNNDFSFFVPDVHIAVTDALRPGHELTYHPGETSLRMADIVVINKVDSASLDDVARVAQNVHNVNRTASVVRAASPVSLDPGTPLVNARVLVIEDGPTITHGGLPFGAGTVAARQAGAAYFVNPRPHAIGSIAATYSAYPHIGAVLPAMGYSAEQLAELVATIEMLDEHDGPIDAIVTGTPIDLRRLIAVRHPIRRARYEVVEIGRPTLAELLQPHLARWVVEGRIPADSERVRRG